MQILKRMLKQRCVYWEPDAPNEHGEEQYKMPVEIKCRWEDELTQGFPFEGKETVFASNIYVDRDVVVGGLLRQGKLEDLKSSEPPADTKRILMLEVIPTLNAKKFLRVAKL